MGAIGRVAGGLSGLKRAALFETGCCHFLAATGAIIA
jgi:hypothetical protein